MVKINRVSIAIAAAAALILMSGGFAFAKTPQRILAAVIEAYPPAQDHRGLQSAYEQPEKDKMRGYGVMEQGGIPAERARFYITWSDYDYRGVVLHLGEADKMTTRRGNPYTYLNRGDVMAVTGIKNFNDTIYLNLLSKDVYVPENRTMEKHHSRVTVMLGFKFPKEVLERDDPAEVLAVMSQWVKPFRDLSSAATYAKGIAPAQPAASPAAAVSPQDEKIKSLEEKIDATRRDLDEAEKELGEMKKSKAR